MNATARLAAILLALAAPGAVVTNVLSRDQRTFSLDGIPTELDRYSRVGEERLDADVLAMIEPDDYLLRVYTPGDGAPVWLYIGLYSGDGSKGAHDPNVCYPAQGWEVNDARDVAVEVADGESLTARVLVAVRGGRSQLVLYWFQAADRWPRFELEEQLLRVYDSLRGAPQYAFVRLSADFSEGEAPEEAMLQLAGQLAPHIRNAVSNSVRVVSKGSDGIACGIESDDIRVYFTALVEMARIWRRYIRD